MCKLEQVHTCHRQHHTLRGVFPASLLASSLSFFKSLASPPWRGDVYNECRLPVTSYALANEGTPNTRDHEREQNTRGQERERDSKDTSNFRHTYPTQHCLNHTDSTHTQHAHNMPHTTCQCPHHKLLAHRCKTALTKPGRLEKQTQQGTSHITRTATARGHLQHGFDFSLAHFEVAH